MEKVRLSWVDRFIGFFSQKALRDRILYRQQVSFLSRGYDAANSYSGSSIKKNSKSANAELKNQAKIIRENVRDLLRNHPFAIKAVQVITNNTISWGIMPKISHPNPEKEKQIKKLWDHWEANCTLDGSDFYSLQAQVMTQLVSDGEVLLTEVIKDKSVRLHLMEPDFIDDTKDNHRLGSFRVVQGVVVDKYDRPKGYYLFDEHPGDLGGFRGTSKFVPERSVIHVFKKDRAGQVRGVSWLHSVLHPLKLLGELLYTQLLRLKLSASITAVVKTEVSGLPADKLRQEREDDFELSPGTVKFLPPGGEISFPQIPNPEGFSGTAKLVLQEIAAGLGITYEALSNDLSAVNFSSARIGHLQFLANIDSWQWHLMIPKFCKPAFERFKKFCALKGVDVTGLSVEWSPPARTMINPREEVSATKEAIRAGLQTLPGALREYGLDLEAHLEEMQKSNELIDSMGIILDSDPRNASTAGQIQSPPKDQDEDQQE